MHAPVAFFVGETGWEAVPCRALAGPQSAAGCGHGWRGGYGEELLVHEAVAGHQVPTRLEGVAAGRVCHATAGFVHHEDADGGVPRL